MNMEAESVMATGELLGGGTGNFMNVMYEFFATNQVSAQFVMDNADFFTTFFSWLGAELTPFPDVPTASEHLGTVDFEGTPVQINVTSDDLSFGQSLFYGDAIAARSIKGTEYIGYGFNRSSDDSVVLLQCGWFDGRVRILDSNGTFFFDGVKCYSSVKSLTMPCSVLKNWGYSSSGAIFPNESSETLFSQNCIIRFVGRGDVEIGMLRTSDGKWIGADGVYSPGSSGEFSPQIIGQDAKYDDAGNITDYGNVAVPDVFAPNYTAPETYADALDQMHATATTENPASADSPTFGQGDTAVKDWVDGNQTPKPDPSDQTAQDGFKVSDLETVFPFCIPWDVYYLLSMLAAEPVAPLIEFPLNFSNFGLDDYSIRVDFGEYESFAVVLRAVEALSFCVGLALVTRNLVRG